MDTITNDLIGIANEVDGISEGLRSTNALRADQLAAVAERIAAIAKRAAASEMLEALIYIAEQCEEHPAYIPNATDADIEREGGDSATITYLAQTARAAIAKATK